MPEIWRAVMDYEGLYEVSSLGRVKSLNYQNVPGRIGILSPGKKQNGYLQVTLCDFKGGKRYMNIHRLVALAFIPNPYNKAVVNHLNEDKEDNRLENLEWATHRENLMHGTVQERQHKKFRKPVIRIAANGEGGYKRYPSVLSTAKDGFNPQAIFGVISGRWKTHYGYKWFYEEGIKNGQS